MADEDEAERKKQEAAKKFEEAKKEMQKAQQQDPDEVKGKDYTEKAKGW